MDHPTFVRLFWVSLYMYISGCSVTKGCSDRFATSINELAPPEDKLTLLRGLARTALTTSFQPDVGDVMLFLTMFSPPSLNRRQTAVSLFSNLWLRVIQHEPEETEEGPHREIAIVDDNVELTNDGFSKSSLAFLPYQRAWNVGDTLIQLLNSKNSPICW